jgi:ribosome recycling factor
VLESVRVKLKTSTDDGGGSGSSTTTTTTAALRDVAQVVPRGRNVDLVVGEPAHAAAVLAAVQGAGLNLSPQRVPHEPGRLTALVPGPTAEARRAAVAECKKAGEEARAGVQKARGEMRKRIQEWVKKKVVRPDDGKKGEKAMEEVTKAKLAEVERVVEASKKSLEAV